MKKIFLRPIMSEKEADALAGSYITDEIVRTLPREDCDVYDRKSRRLLAKYRVGVIPGPIALSAYTALLRAAKPTLNRITAGTVPEEGAYKIRSNGRRSKTTEGIPVDSGIVGYFDRVPRFPNCRMTAFTSQHFDKFKAAYPIIKLVDDHYADLCPKEYRLQRAMADRTSPDFRIPGTSFTTVTVNKNYRTAVHKDAGDFRKGFGNLVALRRGQFTGGILVMVRWGLGFDLQNGDLLMMDVHEWHANTPIRLDNPKAVRLSLVMYYREKMIKCGTAKEELKRVQNRKPGDKL